MSQGDIQDALTELGERREPDRRAFFSRHAAEDWPWSRAPGPDAAPCQIGYAGHPRRGDEFRAAARSRSTTSVDEPIRGGHMDETAKGPGDRARQRSEHVLRGARGRPPAGAAARWRQHDRDELRLAPLAAGRTSPRPRPGAAGARPHGGHRSRDDPREPRRRRRRAARPARRRSRRRARAQPRRHRRPHARDPSSRPRPPAGPGRVRLPAGGIPRRGPTERRHPQLAADAQPGLLRGDAQRP